MSRNKIELSLGILVAMVPFIGFPASADKAILIIAGILLCASGLVAHVQARSEPVARKQREIRGQ